MKTLQLGDFCLPEVRETPRNMPVVLKQAYRERDQIRNQYNDLLTRYQDQQSEIFSLQLQIEELRNLIPQSTISSLPSYARVMENIPKTFSKLTPLRKVQDRSSPSKISRASSESKLPTIKPTSAPISNSSPILNSATTQTSFPITSPPLPTPSVSSPLQPPSFPEQTGPSKLIIETLPTPKRTTRQTHVPVKVPVQIYHDSNLAWSGPGAIRDALRRVFPKQSKDNDFEVRMCFTPKLEDVLQALTQTDLENSVVIIAVMTNNAKERQPVHHTHSLLQRILENLKKQTSSEKIIILESPPSLQFDVYPYNRASYQLCRSAGVFFALSQLERYHIKDDGLHIRDQYKHLMIKSVAAAIMKVNPYIHFGLFPSVRRPWKIAPWANPFMTCT